jgi:N,N-dimethylformamidase
VLIGYVSDERHLALCDVAVLFENDRLAVSTRSLADGSLRADLPPGDYRVALNKEGFGAKRVQLQLTPGGIHRFRILSERLLGYMWPKWVRSGEAAQFRIHSPEPYHLSLWRYGATKELVRPLGWWDEHGPQATMQITPDADYTQFGVQWNRTGYASPWQPQKLVAPERSGLYYCHAKTESGDFFSFPWIVAPRKPSADIAVLACNGSWNAYNNFGGRSNYVEQDGLKIRPTLHARQDLFRYTHPGEWPYTETAAPLSFDRPETFNAVPEDAAITDPIPGRLASAMAPGEWRFLGWLEREGFSYDLYPETDLHFDKIPLEKYRVVVLNMHPEYYSKTMYDRLKAWVDHDGGKLMYLGGCGFYAEVDYPDEATMLCRREGIWEQRGDSAAKLLGTEYNHDGFQSGAPYRVLDGRHWIMSSAGLKAGDTFGSHSLHERCPGGASGHELDKICADSPPNLVHLAKGMNAENSGADLVYFETDSHGAVFSVGSLCWNSSIIVDDGVSAVTKAVLQQFLS